MSLFGQKYKTLRDLYIHELKDLYSAETQITKALPKMKTSASSESLKQAFETHLRETENQVQRLETIGQKLGESLTGHTCEAMKGLVTESSDWISEDAEPAVKDAGLIAAAQRVEHYEMAGYGTARTYAELLGEKEAAGLLQQTLDEEGATDKKLTALSQTINASAAR